MWIKLIRISVITSCEIRQLWQHSVIKSVETCPQSFRISHGLQQPQYGFLSSLLKPQTSIFLSKGSVFPIRLAYLNCQHQYFCPLVKQVTWKQTLWFHGLIWYQTWQLREEQVDNWCVLDKLNCGMIQALAGWSGNVYEYCPWEPKTTQNEASCNWGLHTSCEKAQ